MVPLNYLVVLATLVCGVLSAVHQPPPLPPPPPRGANHGKIVVCNYETKSHFREGQGKFDISNLEPALQYCTHLIYGYAAIKEDTLKLVPLNEQFDVIKDNYRKVTDLKVKFPKLKVLLSVGGNEDVSGEGAEKNLKYRQVLESSGHRLAFINSAHTIIKAYGFDGIDLAWEFPETKPKKIKSGFGKFWSSVKKTFTGETVLDENAQEHRDQFTALVRELKNTFKPDNLLVSLTVLPNINSTVYYDPRALAPNVDFVTLHAFDFYTPQRNPKLADFPSPLYDLIDRRPDENVDAWVKYWLSNGFPQNKLVIGIPSYGRTWKLEDGAKVDTVPPEGLDGAGSPGPLTKDAGILSYPEICVKVQGGTGNVSPQGYRKIQDSTNRRGSYAYKLPDEEKNEEGVWIAYEDPAAAANKATYVRNKGLAGIAVDDLTLDDFKGVCSNHQYSILRAAVAAL
ncbi:chitinase-like protein Idgf4 [Anthonomus grandis grandis]|uniref:chitinase-like protein Idgf4 n=1 Tax=Anthonomus grandis grandis TaxID=2921223 RepID=UPI0021663F77|nr:chitinase-like protein Idgf4 [Anthonomus grandis grandis]